MLMFHDDQSPQRRNLTICSLYFSFFAHCVLWVIHLLDYFVMFSTINGFLRL